MENKRKNIYIAIFVVTTIIASCLAVFFAIKANTDTNTQVAAVDEKLSGESTKTAEDGKTEVQIKEVEKIVEKEVEKGVFVPFDSTKRKLTYQGCEYILERKSWMEISAHIYNDDVYVYEYPTIDQKFQDLGYTLNLPEFSHENSFGEKAKVKGFSKKVVDVLIGTWGNGIDYPIILFLMEDGTVEYLKSEALQTGNLVSAGPIKELENIVRIEQCSTFGENGGGAVPIAIDKDGYFYDVHLAIDSIR